MLKMSDLRAGDIYVHDDGTTYARLLRWVGDSESGGAATIELSGEPRTVGLALFLRKYNTIVIGELPSDATEDQR